MQEKTGTEISNNPKNNYWLRSGIYTMLERSSIAVFGFFGFYFLVRMFTKEEFGSWALFLAIAAFVEVARNGLIQNAQVKFLASAHQDEYPKIITASFVLNIILTGLSILALFFLSKILTLLWDAPQLQTMLYVYMVTTACLIPFSQFNFIQQANLDFRGVFYAGFCRQGFFFVTIAYVYFTNTPLSLQLLVKFQALAALAGALVAYIFVRKYLVFSTVIDWKWVSRLFHFGKYVFGTNISSMIFKSMDQMMLGAMISTASVAIYNAAIRIVNLVEIPTTSIASIVFPQSARLAKSEGNDAVKFLYEKSVGVILAFIVPFIVAVAIFPKFIIVLLAGDKYLDTIPLLQLTILYTVFIPFARQFGIVLDSIGKPKVNFYFLLFSAGLTIVSNYFFISIFGVIGAAYGGLVTYTVCFIINQFVLNKILKVNTLNVFIYMWKFYGESFFILMAMIRKRHGAVVEGE